MCTIQPLIYGVTICIYRLCIHYNCAIHLLRSPIEENLREFENMRKGKYAANEATLRLKMDMTSPNPNMWDQVRDLLTSSLLPLYTLYVSSL